LNERGFKLAPSGKFANALNATGQTVSGADAKAQQVRKSGNTTHIS
jgi:hypothetical protein